MSKKLIAFLVCLVLVLSVLISCAEQVPTPDTPSDPTPPADTPATPENEVDPHLLAIAEDGVANYRIIWDDGLEPPTQLAIQNLLLDYTATSAIEFEASSDEALHPSPKEILVGKTDRDETVYGELELQDGEYIISYHAENDRILILGDTEELTLNGLRYFLNTYTDNNTHSLKAPDDLFYISQGMLTFPIQYLLINGISICRYQIVIPQNADLSTQYAAENLSDYLSLQMGITLPIVSDTTAERPYEILIGDTNRKESDTDLTPKKQEYMLWRSGTKVVMQGNGIYVGAANTDLITNHLQGSGSNRGVRINALATAPVAKTHQFTGTYRNSILMIGDGMGFNHINAALANGLDNFVANEYINQGSAITQSQSVINGNASYTDSAAGGTALSSGYKTINGYIGVDASGKTYKNIRELAHENGAKTAVVTTDTITGATPAAFLCHDISRNNTSILQSQINELQNQNGVTYLAANVGDQLKLKTREALLAITQGHGNFFMMVEEGHIDKNSHSNDTKATIHCVNRFNDTIAYVTQFVFCHPDTALIITADHETGGLIADPNNTYQYRYTTGNHTNADVPVYAFGPETEAFNEKRKDNTTIPQFLALAFGNGKIGKAA